MEIDAVKKTYNRYASVYDLLFGRYFTEGRKVSINMMNELLPAGSSVLEVGVGTGISLPFYKNELAITGIDISGDMLKIAKQLKARLNLAHVHDLIEMDAEKLTFKDNQFDTVMAMHVASVVPHFTPFLDELIRVCKPGGHIVVVNHFSSENTFIHAIEKQLVRFESKIGFTAVFSREPFMNDPRLELITQKKVNMFNFCDVLHFKKR